MQRFIRLPLRRVVHRSAALDSGTGNREPGTGPQRSSIRSRLGPRSPVPGPRGGRARGFTLIELIVVVAIIGILATIAVPAMRTAPIRAREAALREDLFTLRSCIDQFHADRGRFPTSLDELVSMGYLRMIPVDPVTRRADSWTVVQADVSGDEDEQDQDQGATPGIIDVHSGSEDVSPLDGTRYSDW
jgi:general secretion pathway protein G